MLDQRSSEYRPSAVLRKSYGLPLCVLMPATSGSACRTAPKAQLTSQVGSSAGPFDVVQEAALAGRRVLVVEDEFYIGIDEIEALEGAGARAAGPCGTEAEALAQLAAQRPDAAVIDINLGAGVSFWLARHLTDLGIPFVFFTGYAKDTIPAEFGHIERLEKPVDLRRIVQTIARLLPSTV